MSTCRFGSFQHRILKASRDAGWQTVAQLAELTDCAQDYACEVISQAIKGGLMRVTGKARGQGSPRIIAITDRGVRVLAELEN